MSKSEFVFGNVPKVRYRRAKFNLSFNKRFSMSVGSLYPIYLQEIYPGDTFKVKANSVVRTTSAFLKPVMDNLFLDTYYFFVPNRLCYDKWEEVMGENKLTAWAPKVEINVPTLNASTVTSKTVADYLGLPIGNLPAGINKLPFRAFAHVYNEWFRDQNNIDPVLVQTGDSTEDSLLNNDDWSPTNYMGKLPKVAKMHDYFTTCLPDTQKSAEPVSVSLSGYADVIGMNSAGTAPASGGGDVPIRLASLEATGDSVYGAEYTSNGYVKLDTGFSSGDTVTIKPYRWAADLSSSAGGIPINDLRYAVQLQKMLEKDARGGTRYTEYLRSHFSVTSPDSRLQRPEYLGGSRTPINVQQVPQTSQGTAESPLAQLGAYSFSNTLSRYTKSFVEHGFVIGVCCLRQFHTYQQGIEKFWTRSGRYDYYDPLFAHLGEQAVYQSELFAPGQTELKGNVFGYNEAWADLRYRPSQTAGEMRSDAPNTLDIWHFGDDYTNAPTLNEQFINETPIYVDRTLAVPSTSQDQFIVDTYFNQTAYRVLPTYSIPGYVDHDFT